MLRITTQVTVYAQNEIVYSQNTTVNVKRIRQRIATEPEVVEPEPVEPEVEEVEEPEVEEVEEPEPEEPEVEEPEELRTIYSPSEVALMNDREFEEKFIKVTGIHELPCSECSPISKSISTSWMYSIRKRCLKVGLHKDIKMPKTCDRQSKRNDERNDINNKYHRQMKKYHKNPTKFAIEDIKKWDEERVSELKKIGVDARRSKYAV